MKSAVMVTPGLRARVKPWWLTVGVLSVVVLVLAGVAGWQAMSKGPGDVLARAAGVVPAAAPAVSTQTHFGTQPDGQFAAPGGELVLSPELIKRFEYHLAAIGERTVPQIREAILQDLRSSLNAKGLSEAARILDKYLQFKTALASVPAAQVSDSSSVVLAHTFQTIRHLRAQYFSADEVAALFGQGDEYEDYMVKKMAIVQNKNLSQAEQQAALASLTATLSPQSRADVEQPTLHLTLAERVEQARQQGASADQIRAIRTELVGADATRRLEALDREEADWQSRIQQYKAARAADPAQAEQVRNRLFTAQEQLRLAAYE